MASFNEIVPEDSSSSRTEEEDIVPEWRLAREGIDLLINNNSTEAKKLFLKYPDSIVMFAGYSTATFIDALMSLEEDKINLAVSSLKEVEKRCVSETGWLKSVIPKVFGLNESSPPKSLSEQLETQIILADSQVCIGILTFLQQDISGYLKAGWVLRKAWKVYQKVYKDILVLYTEMIGELHLPDPTTIIKSSSMSLFQSQSQSSSQWEVPDTNSTNGYIPHSKISHSKSAILHKPSNDIETSCLDSSKGSKIDGQVVNNRHSYMKKSTSTSSCLASEPNKVSLWKSKFSSFHTSFSLHDFSLPLNLFSSSDTIKDQKIEKHDLERLMGAVSFGFGLFQLGISLLPPSLLRLTNILGFTANRQNGISHLMYARLGKDMRAPLATLSLLWYHTIVRPFYAIDGTNVQAGVDAASDLLRESQEQYSESTLFLFFGGRVARLNSDIKAALSYFQQAAENANQREIKLLSVHEVGWCHLIELDVCSAESVFSYLRTSSRWSKCFYSYLAAICSGASGHTENYFLFEELNTCMFSMQNNNQLDEFLLRRIKYCPADTKVIASKSDMYWILLVYEMLYLWNALPSCSMENIEKIIKNCTSLNIKTDEPMEGLSLLILGCAYCIKGDVEKGTENYRKCLDIRQRLPPNAVDAHISAFAQYELGSLLIKNEPTKQEGKLLLQQMNLYSKYDFEHKLNLRVYTLLKSGI